MSILYLPILLLILALILGSVVVVLYAIGCDLCGKKFSLRLKIMTWLASALLGTVILLLLLAVISDGTGGIDVNPSISSRAELIGTYSDDDYHHTLTLNGDGTYTAQGLPYLTSGTWSQGNFVVALRNSGSINPTETFRLIRRNQDLCIAPDYYDQSDRSDIGILLPKRSPEPGPPVEATIEPPWFINANGVQGADGRIDLNLKGDEKLMVRYGHYSDSGVELELVRGATILWRKHVQRLGVPHSAYQHNVTATLDPQDSSIVRIQSVGFRTIEESRSLKDGRLISRVVRDNQ
ncbi:MAG: hypothetical protein V4662_05630 [Verrucomicrobiota bacterium]